MTTEAIGTKSNAKERIVNALIGLVIALGIFVILSTINPTLTELDPEIAAISIEFEYPSEFVEEGDLSGVPSWRYVLPTDIGIDCPGSGGRTKIPDIVNSFQGKVTYRWGGKGDEPPYPPPSKREYDQCKNEDNQAVACHDYCPDGQVCLDCSGFVYHVLNCAGLNPPKAGVQDLLGDSRLRSITDGVNTINPTTGQYTYRTAGGTATSTLEVGDLLLWDLGDTSRHVIMWIGNGKIVESTSGAGRGPGQAVQIDDLANRGRLRKISGIVPAN